MVEANTARVIDSAHGTIPATPHFDPDKGCQAPSTGVVGGCYFAAMVAAYSVFSVEILDNGGPAIRDALSWLPAPF